MLPIMVLCIAGILVFAWVVGRIHISLVDPSEVGKLTSPAFTARIVVSLAPLSALFMVLGVFEEIVDKLPKISKQLFIILVAVSGMLAAVIAVLSFMEVFWYQSRVLPKTSRRRKFFRIVCMPMLYSSVYLYWVPLIWAWLLFIKAALRS